MKKNNIVYDVCICNDDELSLMVAVCDTIEEASNWLGCKAQSLYNSQHLTGKMSYNGYVIELVERLEA